jgi:hypothetical protein
MTLKNSRRAEFEEEDLDGDSETVILGVGDVVNEDDKLKMICLNVSVEWLIACRWIVRLGL